MRKINLEGADNARDFGGLVNKHGQTLRSQQFIRSNSLAWLTPGDQAKLRENHLKNVIDLRTHTEVNERPNVVIDGVTYHHVPLIDEKAVGITHDRQSEQDINSDTVLFMPKMYAHIVTDEESVAKLAYIFDLIINNEDGATLWHCQAGKDRCGIVSALFLSILDVSPDTIMADYLLTNEVANDWAAARFREIYEVTLDTEIANKYKATFLADELYLRAAHDAIIEKWGSLEDFIEKQLKITPEKAAILKKRMIID